jgi:hypothetical protein
MIKTWNTSKVGDKVLMRTSDGTMVQGVIDELKQEGDDTHHDIVITWDLSDNYFPQYEYPRTSWIGGNFSYESRMFFYTDPQEELVGRFKLSGHTDL